MVGTHDGAIRTRGAAGTGRPCARKRVREREGTWSESGCGDILDVPERDDGQIFREADEIDHLERQLGRGENKERRDDGHGEKVEGRTDIAYDDQYTHHDIGLDDDQLGRHRVYGAWNHMDAGSE
jgi:hypothetical protein